MTVRSLHLLPAALALLLLPAAARPAAAQEPGTELDGVVLASVYGEEITRGHLVRRLLDYQGEEALERMVNRALVLRAAEKAGLSVSAAELDRRMDQIRGQFKSEPEYQRFLKGAGLSEEQHREETRFTLLLQKLALNETPIKDEELQQMEVRLLQAPDEATAERWAKELEGGADFARMTAERSTDLTARQAGGRMTPFIRIELLDVWDAVIAQQLRPGGFTRKPVRLANGNWVLVKLERLIPATSASGSERDRLQTLLTRHRMDQWLTAQREQNPVERLGFDKPVVARVGGREITREALIHRLLEYNGEPTLSLMINRTLLLQAAKRLNVEVTEAEADRTLAEFKQRLPRQEDFEALLTRNHLTERQLRDELRYTTLMERVALKENPITDNDLALYDVRMIEAPNKSVAEKWIAELDAGADFAVMAAQRSKDPQGQAAGGRVRPFLRIQLLDVWRALDEQQVKPGGFTRKPVLLTDNSWAIIKLERIIPASEVTDREREALRSAVVNYRVNMWLTQAISAAQSSGKITRPVALATVIRRPAGN